MSTCNEILYFRILNRALNKKKILNSSEPLNNHFILALRAFVRKTFKLKDEERYEIRRNFVMRTDTIQVDKFRELQVEIGDL